ENRSAFGPGQIGVHHVIFYYEEPTRAKRPRALSHQERIGLDALAMDYIRHPERIAGPRKRVLEIINRDEIDSISHLSLAFGQDAPCDFERGRKIVNRHAELRPSLEQRRHVGSRATSDIRDLS